MTEFITWFNHLVALIAVGFLLVVWLVMRRIHRQSQMVTDTPALWSGRDYRCPGCGGQMETGWVMLGKGAIWSSRNQGPPGPWLSIGQTLPNTLNLSLKPAGNMAWRCRNCQLLLLDHAKLVGSRRRTGGPTHSA